MKRFNKALLLLVLINAVIYRSWISFSVFTFSDWAFHFKEAIADFLVPTVWNSTWTSGFGYVDILLWKLPVYLYSGVIGRLGFDYNVVEKFVVFWPIIFGASIGSFLLLKHILKSDSAAFIGSLVFSLNTYFLSIDTQGHQFLTAGFAFSTFALLTFIKLVEEKKLFFAVLTSLLLFVVGAYDLRSLYITFGILFLYLTYYTLFHLNEGVPSMIRIWSLSALSIVIYVLLSLYWLLPLLSVQALTNNSTLGRQIFGNEFYNIQAAITTFFPFWTGRETAWFTLQNIPLYFWFYPLLAIFGLIAKRGNKNVLFFALVALIGIFLSKQADIPFPDLYNWMYTRLPGFSAFREASKFDFMISLGYAVLIGSFVSWLMNRKQKSRSDVKKYLPIVTIALLALWNGFPLFTQDVKSLFVPHTVPSEYRELNSFITGQPDYFRTYWLNMSAAWQIYDNKHPQIDGNLINNSDWSEIYLNSVTTKLNSEGEKEVAFLGTSTMDRLLDMSSVKYVVVPLSDPELNHDIVNYFGKNHEFYENQLAKIPHLKQLNFSSGRILLYENMNYKSHIYLTQEPESVQVPIAHEDIASKLLSPSEYQLSLRRISEPLYINFSENYHPSWSVRVGNVDPIREIFQNPNVASGIIHAKNVAGFNEFFVDPTQLCGSENSCSRNADGSYNTTLTIYFTPQSKLYLGIVLSALTLFMCLIYLLAYAISKKTR